MSFHQGKRRWLQISLNQGVKRLTARHAVSSKEDDRDQVEGFVKVNKTLGRLTFILEHLP